MLNDYHTGADLGGGVQVIPPRADTGAGGGGMSWSSACTATPEARSLASLLLWGGSEATQGPHKTDDEKEGKEHFRTLTAT